MSPSKALLFAMLAGMPSLATAETCLVALSRSCAEVPGSREVGGPSGCKSPGDGGMWEAKADDEADACEKLALQANNALGAIQNAIANAESDRGITMRDIEPVNRGFSGTQGSPAQVEAVPLQPVSMTSANAALVATKTGFRIIANGAINPAALLTDVASGSRKVSPKSAASASRSADISILLPIDPAATGTQGTQAFDYVGVRLRVSLLGWLSADRMVEGARAVYARALTRLREQLQAAGDFIDAATVLISKAPHKYDCRMALGAGDAQKIESACGDTIGPTLRQLIESDGALRNALSAARAEADRSYLGADIRMDLGDPSFSKDPAARGAYLLTALAGGIRWNFGEAQSGHAGVRFRTGASAAWIGGQNIVSFDGAIAFEIGVTQELHETSLSFGLDGRFTRVAPPPFDTNYLDSRVGLSIPLGDGGKIGLSLGFPIIGSQHGTTVSVSGNWAALLGKQ